LILESQHREGLEKDGLDLGCGGLALDDLFQNIEETLGDELDCVPWRSFSLFLR
jgi:hypothetical protein